MKPSRLEVKFVKARHWIPLLLLFFFVPISAVTPLPESDMTPPELDYWPTDGWRTSSPEAQDMNSQVLDLLYDELHSLKLCYNSFIVVRHGYIVFETYPSPIYDQDRLHFLASTTKSVMAGVFGIAVDQGYIGSVHDSVLGYFPNRTFANPSPLKDSMTVRDLLTMKTGLAWDEGAFSYDDPRNSFVQWIESPDPVQYFLDLPMACPPDRRWYYNTGASSMLSTLITVTTGESTHNFAREWLFQPLGITRSAWEADLNGINYGGFGLNLLPRDMAKYGLLYLQNGRWDNQQIISTDWIAESTFTHTVFYQGYGYGYHWITFPAFNGYAAFGAGGQGIFVIPKYDLVIIVTAEEPVGVPFVDLILAYVIQSLYDAEPVPVSWKLGWILTLTLGITIPLVYVYWFNRTRRITKAEPSIASESE
jgi:CubicO group peptidase (beta-lactamase class C family)